MAFFLGIFLGIFLTYLLEQLLQKNKVLRKELWEHHKPILGYHVHHSIFGIPLILLGIIFLFFPGITGILLIGLGLGIIIMHTYSAKEFKFIEKSNKERKNKQVK